MLRTTIARSVAEIESLRTAWEGLYRGGGWSLFQSFAWNLLAARVFAGREAPRVVHVESDNGQAIVPACIRADGRLGLLGETLFDYRDVLVAGDREVLRGAWEVLAREGHGVAVTGIAGEGARREWEEFGFSTIFFCNAARVRRADMSAGEFRAAHRHPIEQMRRLRRQGAEVRVHAGEPGLVKEIYRRKSEQTKIPKNLFADPARVEFGVEAAVMDPGCEVFTVEAGSTLVAGLVTYRDDSVRRLYTIWKDDAWGKYSPGIVLLYEAARRALEEGMDCDLMTGEQPHKARFATSRMPLYHVNATAEQLAEIGRGRRVEPLAA